jgi:DNA repair exonuclease SbcCD nuclease subunit
VTLPGSPPHRADSPPALCTGVPPLRFIHTADWQIGKNFGFLDDSATHALQDARLEAITTIGRLAREHHASTVLVAGDIYERDAVGDLLLDQPLERMRSFPGIAWHLIPGNHDSDRPSGVWDRLCRRGLPANIHVHRVPAPAPICEGVAWLLPAPLRRRHSLIDLTTYMDDASTPEGALRLGLAHGSMREFGSIPGQTANPIAPSRPQTARLDYLALGDWHSTLEVGPRCWYSGTPEPDDFDQQASGAALLVDLAGPGALPSVSPLATGSFHWHREQAVVHGPDDIKLLAERLRARLPDPARLLVRLEVEGTLSLADRLCFDEQIGQRLRAALRCLDLRDRLLVAPRPEDLDAIASGGVLRAAVERLSDRIAGSSGEEREIAQMALLRLCVEHARIAS